MNGTKGIRGLNDNSDTVTDCQFVVHEPLQHDTTTRTAHLDNPVEIYAGLFYLKRPDDLSSGGDFEIYSTENDETIVDQALGRQVDPTAISISKTVRYRPNAFCVFEREKQHPWRFASSECKSSQTKRQHNWRTQQWRRDVASQK